MLSLTMASIGMSGWIGFIGLVDVDLVEVQEFIMACLTFCQVLAVPGPCLKCNLKYGGENREKSNMAYQIWYITKKLHNDWNTQWDSR